MSILLVSPPREIPVRADFPPIGLCSMAANLRKNGFVVHVIDASNYTWKRLEKEILRFRPDQIGITCWTIERKMAYAVARLAREILPDVKILMGGQHATFFANQMFAKAYADVVGIGECDETIVEVVRCLDTKQDLQDVRGIAFKENGAITMTPMRDFIENLDGLPFPDYSDFDLDLFNGLPESRNRAAAIITSRGCPYKCTFCSSSRYWDRKWRCRSTANVLAEIGQLYAKGVRSLLIFDDNFAINKDRVVEICSGIIERKYNLSWVCCTRVDQVDNDEILTWLKKAGCYRIDFGIESGSDRILRNIDKGITSEKIIRVFESCHRIGILPRANLMVGNPGETADTIDETVGLMKKIRPFQSFTGQILWVLPGTKIYEMAKEKKLIDDDWWLHNDQTPFYLGEYSLRQLVRLKKRLEFGLAKNEGTPIAFLRYALLRLYFRFSLFRRFYSFALAYQKSVLGIFIKRSAG